jgi:acetoin utilization deacetylase AcuC-like enzyme
VTEEGFSAFARVLLRIARDHAKGRCAALLEGGYDLIGLEKSALRVLDEMGGEQLETALPEVDSRPLLPQVLTVQRNYWELPQQP